MHKANAPYVGEATVPATPDRLPAADAAMFPIPPSLLIAARYATSTGSFTSFVARVALLGLVFSVAVLLLVMSIMNGFERELLGRLLGIAPHASLHLQEPSGDWNNLNHVLDEHAEVVAHAQVVRGAGMLSSGQRFAGVTLVGIDPTTYAEISDAGSYLVGVPFDFSMLIPGEFRAILGSRLAEQLQVSVGDQTRLLLSQAVSTPFGVVPRSKRIHVLGSLHSGTELDGYWMWLHKEDAAILLRGTPSAQAVDLRLADPMRADAVAYELALATETLDDSWKRRFGPLYQAVISTKGVMFILLSLLIGVAAFNLISTLIMVVNQRHPDLAILSTMGASGADRMSVAAWLGVMIGGFGTLLGLGLGYLLSLFAPEFYEWLESSFHLGLMDRYFISYLPTDPQVGELLRIGVVTMVLSLLATLYPALRALKMRPAEVLSNE